MRIVIVGTGTDVGKTHLGVALVTALARRGETACALKPIESGVPDNALGPDTAALSAASLFHVKHPPPYAFPDPVSPHLAARRAGQEVDLSRVQRWVDEHRATWVLIETAGALLSPIAPALTNLDLAQALAPSSWIVVGLDRLGVLHDIAACQLALTVKLTGAALGITVVLQTPATPDASTGTNAAELQLLGIADKVFTMPRSSPTSPACQAIAESLLSCLHPTSLTNPLGGADP